MPVVLIVEDDLALANLYDGIFKDEGFGTMVARDGETGLGMALSKSPDFIILDMGLPKMTGMEVFEKLIASPIGKTIPVMFLTNNADKNEREKVMKLGAKDYITKAMFSPEAIMNKVKGYLAPKI